MRRQRVLRGSGGLSVRVDVRSVAVVAALAVLSLLAGLLLVGTGDFPLTPVEVVRTLLGEGTAAQRFVVEELRLPRALVALLTGAALGLSGAVFQSVSRNPLGSPDFLGIGQGAVAGALSVIVLVHGGAAAVAAGAAVGGLLTGAVIYLLSWRGGVHGYRLVLVGIGTAAVLTAVNGYLLTRAELVDAARATVWMTGSLGGRDWGHVRPLLVACVVLVPVVLATGRALGTVELGDDLAAALGVRVQRVRLVAMLAAVLLTAAATAAAGPIAFVALTAPQLARRLTRASGPHLLPAAAMGALLLAAADWAAQCAFGDTELPAGVVTGVLGGCYLLWLLVGERRQGRI